MIENIHSHEGEEPDASQITYAFKPPKNIRQIGESTSQKKIYVEDYVFTYIKELVKKEYAECRIMVLLGHYVKTQDSRIILINGAVEAEGIQYDLETVFNNDTWTSVYENIKKYFNDVEVVGWCIGGPGFILENEEKLKKIHLDNFAGVDKALLKYDSMENEEAFYIYEHGTLNRQSGYYIYYEKNEDMQNYIMEYKSSRAKSGKQKEEEAVKEYKEEVREQKAQENNKSIMHLMYAAGSLMVVIVIIVFAAMINNSNQIRQLEASIDNINSTLMAGGQGNQNTDQVAEGTSEETADTQGSLEVETISGNLNSIKSEEVIGDKSEESTQAADDNTVENEEIQSEQKTEDTTVSAEEQSAGETEQKASEETVDNQNDETTKTEQGATGEETVKESETKEAETTENTETQPVSSTTEVKYYEVEKGDTLVGISFKLYDSGDYVSKIMELNGIEDMDMIYYGQKLIVP